MLPALIASALVGSFSAPTVERWYGPAEVHFKLASSGNPYDSDVNNVEVLFTSGHTIERRLAYFDGSQWCARLASSHAGTYKASAYQNGHMVSQVGTVRLTTLEPLPYVRVHEGRFMTSDGKPFWPIGHSLAWQNGGAMPLTQQLALMGSNGITWTRIWATHFDGRNPYWTKDGLYLQSALQKWDALTRAAEGAGVRFQLTLHHHGQVSSTVNPNWQEHPWNAKNGGFLPNAVEFFTNAEAKKRTKAYLRYMVARYGDSPAIMAWELFNEVQFSDAARQGHWDLVGAWHREMATYLRSIDPYHHLITTSSEIGAPIWEGLDYYQAHGYPSSVSAMVLGDKFPKDRPYFWGEIGAGNDANQGAGEHLVVRDGIWSGILAGNAGSAEYWDWDRMEKPGMYDEYKRATFILRASRFVEQTGLRSGSADIQTSAGADLSFSPGVGWGRSLVSSFELPRDARPEVMGKFSSFLQGKAHPEMSPPTAKFSFTAPAAGTFGVRIAGVSEGGTTLVALVDGIEVKRETFAAHSKPAETWSLDYPVGKHTVTLRNDGGDWVQLGGFTVSGIAPAITGSWRGGSRWLMLRVQRGADMPTFYSVSGLPLADGLYRSTSWDLDTGVEGNHTLTIREGRLPAVTLAAKDQLVVIQPVERGK